MDEAARAHERLDKLDEDGCRYGEVKLTELRDDVERLGSKMHDAMSNWTDRFEAVADNTTAALREIAERQRNDENAAAVMASELQAAKREREKESNSRLDVGRDRRKSNLVLRNTIIGAAVVALLGLGSWYVQHSVETSREQQAVAIKEAIASGVQDALKSYRHHEGRRTR